MEHCDSDQCHRFEYRAICLYSGKTWNYQALASSQRTTQNVALEQQANRLRIEIHRGKEFVSNVLLEQLFSEKPLRMQATSVGET